MAASGPALLLIMTLWLSLQPHYNADANFNYNFAECSQWVYHRRRVDGAEVRSQHEEFYQPDTSNCTLILTTIVTHIFLIQLTHLDLAKGQTGCHDYLTIVDLHIANDSRQLLNSSCSSGPQYWYTTGQRVLFNFNRRGNSSSSHRGFRISVAALTRPPVPCDEDSRFQCEDNEDCISQSLTCDGVQHCLQADDENPKLCPSPPPPAPTTPGVFTATEPASDDESNFYLWLPLIVVVVFTLVMVMLIMAGRRVTSCNNGYSNPQTEASILSMTTAPMILVGNTSSPRPGTVPPGDGNENVDMITIALVSVVFVVVLVTCLILGFREQKNRQQEQLNNNNGLEINSNPGFTDGAPATPPPTYSMIERQTSYVSQISQTSSQLSIPPDYDEVVQDGGPENTVNGVGRRRRRLTSRSNSDSWRRPWFRRSNSAQAATGPRARFASESSGIPASNRQRPRYFSDNGVSGDTRGQTSALSESDSVFLDPPPPGRNVAIAASPSAPSGLEGVLEADETGSSGNVTSSSSDRPSTVSSTSASLLLANQVPSHGNSSTAPQLSSHSPQTSPHSPQTSPHSPQTSPHREEVSPQSNTEVSFFLES